MRVSMSLRKGRDSAVRFARIRAQLTHPAIAMSTSISPLAPAGFPAIPAIGGVKLATLAAGLRYAGRDDLMLASMPEGTTAAGTFTRSLCPSAPVVWCKGLLPAGRARALVCNAGNANAFTGLAGDASTALTADAVADALAIATNDVYVASTGVIGEPMPDDALRAAIPGLAQGLQDATAADWEAAGRAITTTDTFPKGAWAEIMIDGKVVRIGGFAKGSGMIAPNMGTMLCFLFTDLEAPADRLQSLLLESVGRSFNRITVDSDTSTSDTALLFATGASGGSLGTANEAAFRAALDDVTLDLAHQIVRDGEGATKFAEIAVRGASSDQSAEVVAMAVGNSPLVKTMLAASDANWGRIVMAVGKAGQPADRDRLAIWIGDEQCAAGGQMKAGYSEEAATRHLLRSEVRLAVDLGVGGGEATIWTCDLTHGYVDINAGYRS
jgi:glutamate N-acetyltransferase/amino-acid N-acetyltransferase